VPVHVRLGKVPDSKGRHQDTYLLGRRHDDPRHGEHHGGQAARQQGTGPAGLRQGNGHRGGQGLLRFFANAAADSGREHLRDPHQDQYRTRDRRGARAPRQRRPGHPQGRDYTPDRQKGRGDRHGQGKAATCARIQGGREQGGGDHRQQPGLERTYDRRPVQKTLGHRAFFQGDQAEPADQDLRRNQRERRQVPDIRRPDNLSTVTVDRKDDSEKIARLFQFRGKDKDVPVLLPYPRLRLQPRGRGREEGTRTDKGRFRRREGLIFHRHLIFGTGYGAWQTFFE